MIEEQEHSNHNNTETQKNKKFVFLIYPENVNFVENLSYQEKNDLVNKLLDDYQTASIINKKFNRSFDNAKKAIIIILAIVIGIPLILYLTNISLHYTKNSYSEMQRNFEKLF